MDDYDSLLPPFPKSSNWSSVVCDVSMKLSRRLKRRMDRAWASSRGGRLENDPSHDGATCQSLSKRHQSTRTTNKDSSIEVNWGGRFNEAESNQPRSNTWILPPPPLPYSCFNPSRSRGKMLIFFETDLLVRDPCLGGGGEGKLVDLSRVPRIGGTIPLSLLQF